jgi:hypothetical protein
LSSRVVALFEEISPPQRSATLGLIVRRWVIRKSDLNVIRSVSDAAVAAGAARVLDVGTMRSARASAVSRRVGAESHRWRKAAICAVAWLSNWVPHGPVASSPTHGSLHQIMSSAAGPG